MRLERRKDGTSGCLTGLSCVLDAFTGSENWYAGRFSSGTHAWHACCIRGPGILSGDCEDMWVSNRDGDRLAEVITTVC